MRRRENGSYLSFFLSLSLSLSLCDTHTHTHTRTHTQNILSVYRFSALCVYASLQRDSATAVEKRGSVRGEAQISVSPFLSRPSRSLAEGTRIHTHTTHTQAYTHTYTESLPYIHTYTNGYLPLPLSLRRWCPSFASFIVIILSPYHPDTQLTLTLNHYTHPNITPVVKKSLNVIPIAVALRQPQSHPASATP